MVNLNIRIDEDLYYRLMKLKAELKCKNWREFVEKIINIVEKELEWRKMKPVAVYGEKEIISI